MSTTVQVFTFNGFQENTAIAHDGSSAVIFDPGCSNRQEQDMLANYLEENGLQLEAVLLTHAHLDHVWGLAHVVEKYEVPVYLHKLDQPTLEMGPTSAQLYGIPGFIPPPTPDHWLEGGEELSFGSMNFKVLFTPGHAPGHVVFHNEEDGYVINGDVLFAGSFGRVDLPGGDMETLKRSIFEVMFKLPDTTTIYCGHGPETTIGQEKMTNYILNF